MRQSNPDEVTFASDQVMFKVEAGDLVLFNSWLPHGFTRHESDQPFQFIHFNVYVEDTQAPEVEIV
jgi:ectoine hydroxylase-related dioxygenase (phytanoyl-CoA dioxygenase family)